MMTTLYEVLGVKENATQTEIEEAYLNIIKFYQYKDSMVGKINKQAISFQEEIEMAYEVLSDAKSKEEYDLYLKSAKKEKDYWTW